MLERASITFQTNDDDKDSNTNIFVGVRLMDETVVATLNNTFGTFHDNTERGPFDLELMAPQTRGDLKTGHVIIQITTEGFSDTWRFNFFLDLYFDDRAHLIARATGLELSESNVKVSFGIE